VNTVIRMTVTATLVMIIVETFRIPNAFLAALLRFSWLAKISPLPGVGANDRPCIRRREPLHPARDDAVPRLPHYSFLLGNRKSVSGLFRYAHDDELRSRIGFAIPIGVALPVWDRSLPSEVQVEGTLWPVLIIVVGAGVTVGTEALYRIFDRSDPLITSVDDLLLAVQQVAESIAAHAPPKSILDRVLQYDMIGTGRLRMTLQRQGVDPTRRAQRSALISLAGRLIGLAADLERSSTPAERRRRDPPTRTF
jgi:multidrug resistance protein MdtO